MMRFRPKARGRGRGHIIGMVPHAPRPRPRGSVRGHVGGKPKLERPRPRGHFGGRPIPAAKLEEADRLEASAQEAAQREDEDTSRQLNRLLRYEPFFYEWTRMSALAAESTVAMATVEATIQGALKAGGDHRFQYRCAHGTAGAESAWARATPPSGTQGWSKSELDAF